MCIACRGGMLKKLRLWLKVLLELVLIYYLFAYVVIYNCTNMFVSLGKYAALMYQSFLNCEWLF